MQKRRFLSILMLLFVAVLFINGFSLTYAINGTRDSFLQSDDTATETPSEEAASEASAANDSSECDGYVVQPLDTLDVVGQELDVSVVSLQYANNLFRAVDVRIGMCLIVPEDAPPYGEYPALDDPGGIDTTLGQGGGIVDGETYVVQPRDTLDTIGFAFDVSTVSIQLANNIVRVKDIQPGQTLIIPADAPPWGQYPAIMSIGLTGESYRVVRGDTLVSIAEAFGIPAQVIQQVNRIDTSADIFPGRTLIIPESVPDLASLGQGGGLSGEIYVTQPRESLRLIARNLDKDVQCIVDGNGLTKALLEPGQALLIPDDCGPFVDIILPIIYASESGDAGNSGAAMDSGPAMESTEEPSGDGESVEDATDGYG